MSIVRYFALTPVFLVLAISVNAQLPPAAQKALDAGIASAKAGDFPAAIKSLDEARKIAPDSPAVYFNLGLAESKIPGRELRAVCALEAYLALSPNAENAAAVRSAINGLEATSRNNIDKLIAVLKTGFANLSGQPRYGRQPEVSLPVLFLKYGQPEAAEATIKAIKGRDSYSTRPDDARFALLKTFCTMNRLDDAVKQADLITDGSVKGNANGELAKGYIAAGRFREAKSVFEMFNRPDMDLLLEMAVAEYKAGMTDDAEARFQDARNASISESKRAELPWWAVRDIPDLAYARWRMGQKDAAEILLKQTLTDADGLSGKSPNAAKVMVILSLSSTLEQMGRHAEALKIMDKAEKYWQNEKRDKEEGVGITSESYKIYNQYKWLKEWQRAEKFIVALGVTTVFENGMEGLKHWIAQYQGEIAVETARVAATDAVNKSVADGSATSAQRATMWMQYSDSFMSAPIFTTDFNVMIKNLVDYTPPIDDSDKTRTVFARVEEPAEALIDALNNIHAMRERKAIITNWPL